MSLLAVTGAVVMMVFGGIGIDMMHAELNRNKVQNTLDRAVLAAADVTNDMDPEQVVNEYLSAMGLGDALVSVTAEVSSMSKRVSAEGYKAMPSNFLGLLGVDNIQADGAATASNALNGVEISLVLDVSGSMSGAKLDQLKDAAKGFIDTVLPEGETDGSVTLNLIPYSAVVSLGTDVSDHYALSEEHNYSHCPLIPTETFESTFIDPSETLQQLSHFDLSTGGGDQISTPWCPEGNAMSILVHSSDPEIIKSEIDSLVAYGNTAIDLGMIWGASLLDPATASTVEDMIASGLVPATSTGRPGAFNDPKSQKYIVVMTDGQNTSQFDLKPDVRTGLSDVWVDTNNTEDRSDDRMSIRMREAGDEIDVYVRTGRHHGYWTTQTLSEDVFMWTHAYGSYSTALYHSGPYDISEDGAVDASVTTLGLLRADDAEFTEGGAGDVGKATPSAMAYEKASCKASFKSCDDATESSEAANYAYPVRLSNQELYAGYKLQEVANIYYWQAYLDGQISYEEYVDKFYVYEAVSDSEAADSRLSAVCGAARAQGTVIYAIGVEAPEAGLAAMQDCASSMSHYYDVSGSELEETFGSIARTMSLLKLTQ